MRNALFVPVFLGFTVWLPAQDAAGQSLADGGAALNAQGRELSELNVSITVFETGVPEDPLEQRRLRVDASIREVEAILLPFMLRQVLVETNEWGAVRVVPEPDSRAELRLTARIVQSDGITLALALRAVDSTGRVWLDDTYVATAARGDQPGAPDDTIEHYQTLFDQVADVLEQELMFATQRVGLGTEPRCNVHRVVEIAVGFLQGKVHRQLIAQAAQDFSPQGQ